MLAYRPIGRMECCPDPKKTLVETALKLFASRGYHNTSIADILEQSGCTRGTLYYHFSSKEELGYAAIDEAMRQLVEEGAASHFQTNEHPIDRLVKVIDSLPSLAKLGAKGASASDVAIQMAAVHDGFRKRLARSLEALTQQVEEMVCRGVAEGQIANSVDPVQLAHMVATMGAGMQLGSLLWDREVIREDAKRWLKEYLNSLRR